MIDYFTMILGGTKVESHEIRPGVYRHTFTPPGMTTGDVYALLDRIEPNDEPFIFPLSGKMEHRIMPLFAHGKRLERRRKIKRRQHRAAFRRRKRGLA